jgi:pantetheine-phosphate adenylyltransferase
VKTTGLFLGSFDPITFGHIDLIERSSKIFQHVIVGLGNNPTKTYSFNRSERWNMVKTCIPHLDNVSVVNIDDGRISCDIAYEYNATLIRGVRNSVDVDYEKFVGRAWKLHQPSVDIFILNTSPDLEDVSSSSAKMAAKLNGHTEKYVPLHVKEKLERLEGQCRIGITGSIASGKTTLVNELVRLYKGGVKDICLDTMASNILFEREEPVYKILRQEILDNFELKELTKSAIAAKIFKSEDNKNWLNDKIKPAIETRIRASLKGVKGLVIFNSALLVDRDMLDYVNNNLVVLGVSEEDQLKRLIHRNHTKDQAEYRIAAQLSTKEKIKKAGYKIVNDNYGNLLYLEGSENRTRDTVNFINDKLNFEI